MVGRLEGRAQRAPSGKRDFISHFGSSSREFLVLVEEEVVEAVNIRESMSREKKREELRPCYKLCSGTPCTNRHLPF